ncbi:MAG TPA: cupin domain-containing protein [Acetobacteraceae bacterium]|nr:cupin domain-containing protein [Acetobacteraceae bacterium]
MAGGFRQAKLWAKPGLGRPSQGDPSGYGLAAEGLAPTGGRKRADEGESVMKVVTLKNIPEAPAPGAAEPTDGFSGPVHRTRQTIIEPGQSANFNCSIVNFSQGCNTGWHVHDCDQILIVTSGSGWVATETERLEIKVGDVAHVKAGERHWHGAKADTTMGHITITLEGSKATWG